mmetsp:Transcript_20746/g.65647  ORF Transcript_20746/g.65647 Transcript_20746/m.65647 type:complete len:734 (+) Transcript_20746:301-2502(+)
MLAIRVGGYGDAKGYYHWVVGQDVSSAASIAAYFASLTGGVEPPGILASLVKFSEFLVEGGVYCCYDAFSRLDLRCELSVPGGVSLHAVDGHGNTVDVDAGLWKGALVSAFMREKRLDRAALVQAGCVQICEMLQTPSLEGRLLKCIKDLYQAGVVSSSRYLIQERDVDGGDALAAALCDHFTLHERLIQGVDFFVELLQWEVDTAVYAAVLQERLGLHNAALETLEGAVDVQGDSVPLLVALSNMLLRSGEVKTALQVARRAVRAGNALRGTWLALARAYLANDAPRLAMVSINLMPAPPMEIDEMVATFVVVPPQAMGVTRPLGFLHNPNVEEEVKVAEESQQAGREDLMMLSAAHLLPLLPPAAPDVYDLSEGCSSELSARIRAEVYAILVEMTNVLGWNGFLEVRASVFIMEDREQKGKGVSSHQRLPSNSGGRAVGSEDEYGESDEADVYESESEGQGTEGDQPPSPRSPPPPGPPTVTGNEVTDGTGERATSPGSGAGADVGHVKIDDEGGGDGGVDDTVAAEKKRICAMWLDELIQALYEDLSEYMDWRLLEWRARRARKRAGLGATVGGVFSDDDDESDDEGEWDGEDADEIPPLSTGQADWHRRGALCERLLRPEDAERAYRVCVHEGFNMSSWVSLARLYANWAWTGEALMAVAQILAHHDFVQDYTVHRRIPTCIRQTINSLIKRVGLQEVRAVQRQLGELHPAASQLLFDSVEWHTVGFDR